MKTKNLILPIVWFGLFLNYTNAQQIPVTDKSFNNDQGIFRFAIMSDRTGGMQPGIFKQAIDKVNLMQPEFVVSVGDLIDGYTEDSTIWNAQWDEFDAIVKNLDMPFYYLPGNHDASNKLMIEAWHKRLGKDYYHFKYKDVLFLALNTDELEGGGIGLEQVAYAKKVLAENQDVKWTLVFMHRPLWSYGDRSGYDDIEKALGKRPYTVFSGHHHHYRYKMQNGMEHFTLATTGGGSNLRGANVGEFHHITWVTMKEDGPTVAHVELLGICDKNVVHESDYEDIQILRKGNWLHVVPYVHPQESFERIAVKLIFENTSQKSLAIKGELPKNVNFSFSPNTIADTLLPNTKKEILVDVISNNGKTSLQLVNDKPLGFDMQAGFKGVGGDDIFLNTTKVLLADWQHKASVVDKAKVIDAELADWSGTDFIPVTQPQFFNEGWDWKGTDDGTFRFAVGNDNKRLYLAIQFTDELTILGKDISERQDKFYVHLDTQGKRFEIELAASGNANKPRIHWLKGSAKGLDAAITKTVKGQVLEMAIPLSELNVDKKLVEAIRINIGVMDHDRPENTKPSVLWWRPIWGSKDDYSESGVFKIAQ